jgi:integral membrane protein
VTSPGLDPITPASPTSPAQAKRLRSARSALLRYRFMAFFTGVMLIILTFVAIPLQVWGHNATMVHIFGFIHGWGYIIYLLAVADLGLRLRWGLVRLLLVALAGTVPFCSFIAEHLIMQRIRSERPELSAPRQG